MPEGLLEDEPEAAEDAEEDASESLTRKKSSVVFEAHGDRTTVQDVSSTLKAALTRLGTKVRAKTSKNKVRLSLRMSSEINIQYCRKCSVTNVERRWRAFECATFR